MNKQPSSPESLARTRRQVLVVCIVIIPAALLQYALNSHTVPKPRIVQRYVDLLASSLLTHLPSRFVASGLLSGQLSKYDARFIWKKKYRHHMLSIARRYDLDPRLLEALIQVESGFRHEAISPRGAVGLMQVLPTTALEVGISNPFDPIQNLHAGCRYLKFLKNRYKGDLDLTLAAYNAGPGAVDKFGGIPPYPETQRYVQKIRSLFNGSYSR